MQNSVHPEVNAFYEMPFGESKEGIHMAAGPDRLHLFLEGLGKAMVVWIALLLLRAGTSELVY